MKTEQFIEKYGAEFISSRANGTVVSFGKLSDKKHRDESRLFLSEGIKLAEEALRHSHVTALIFCETAVREGKAELLALAETALAKGIRILLVSEPAFQKLTSEKAPQGVIAVSEYMENHTRAGQTELAEWQTGRQILILDTIQDAGNLGTMIRSAAAMGFFGIITVNCADIYSTKVLRASMGAIYRCHIYCSDDPVGDVALLRRKGRRVLAAALGTVSLTLGETELYENDCVVIGNEGHGIDKALLAACDAALKIPMTEGSESLNAAAAAAMILWEYHKQFQ